MCGPDHGRWLPVSGGQFFCSRYGGYRGRRERGEKRETEDFGRGGDAEGAENQKKNFIPADTRDGLDIEVQGRGWRRHYLNDSVRGVKNGMNV